MAAVASAAHRIGNQTVDWTSLVQWIDDEPWPAEIPVRISTATISQAKWLLKQQQAGRMDLTIDRYDSQIAMTEATSRDGIISATLGEVATRADVVWMLGDFSSLARIRTRLGTRSNVLASEGLSADEALDLSVAQSDHPIASLVSSAEYLAIVLGPGAFVGPKSTSALAAEWLSAWVRKLNGDASSSRRAVLLPFSAQASMDAVSLWTTNALPSSARRLLPDHPQNSRWIRWGTPISESSDRATIQIGGVDPGAAVADAYVATQLSGVDRADAVVRGDSSVTLPLDPAADLARADHRAGLDAPQAAFERLFLR